MTEAVDDTASALTQVARALVLASYNELSAELGADALRPELGELARRWLQKGIVVPAGKTRDELTATQVEDQCADDLLGLLGLTRDDIGYGSSGAL